MIPIIIKKIWRKIIRQIKLNHRNKGLTTKNQRVMKMTIPSFITFIFRRRHTKSMEDASSNQMITTLSLFLSLIQFRSFNRVKFTEFSQETMMEISLLSVIIKTTLKKISN